MSGWRERLDELAKLERGWLDGEGEPLSAEGVHWIRDVLAPMLDGLPPAILAPTPEGHLSVAWKFGSWMPSLEINLLTHRGDFHTCDVSLRGAAIVKSTDSCELDLSTITGRTEVVRIVLRDMTRSRKG